MATQSKKKMGRPATGKGTRVTTRLHADIMDPLDAYAAKQPDQPSRAEAIRRILREYLKREEG